MRSALGLLGFLLLILSVAAPAATGAALPVPLAAGSPVVFDASTAQNLFPAGMRFQAEVRAEGEIVVARIRYQVEGEAAAYQADVPLKPGRQTRLDYYWDTRAQGVPPGAAITYRWEVTAADGERAGSAAQTVAYSDRRYLWESLAGECAEVWWHDAPRELASQVLAVAGRACEHQWRMFGERRSQPARIILYNSREEFAAWQPAVPAFVAGKAFPELGLTVQVTEAGAGREDWLNAVIPHEMSRLHFWQVAGGARSKAPAWLAEGLALYDEFVEHPREERALQAAVLRRDLAPLADLEKALASTEEERVRMAQAEALSAVTYLMWQYGPEKVAGLVASFRGGQAPEEVFKSVLGLPPQRVEENWQIWAGVPEAWRAQMRARAAAAAEAAKVDVSSAGPAQETPGASLPAPVTAPTPIAAQEQAFRAEIGGLALLAIGAPAAVVWAIGSRRGRKERERS